MNKLNTLPSEGYGTICQHDKLLIASEFNSSYALQPVVRNKLVRCWVSNSSDWKSGSMFHWAWSRSI